MARSTDCHPNGVVRCGSARIAPTFKFSWLACSNLLYIVHWGCLGARRCNVFHAQESGHFRRANTDELRECVCLGLVLARNEHQTICVVSIAAPQFFGCAEISIRLGISRVAGLQLKMVNGG